MAALWRGSLCLVVVAWHEPSNATEVSRCRPLTSTLMRDAYLILASSGDSNQSARSLESKLIASRRGPCPASAANSSISAPRGTGWRTGSRALSNLRRPPMWMRASPIVKPPPSYSRGKWPCKTRRGAAQDLVLGVECAPPNCALSWIQPRGTSTVRAISWLCSRV